MNEWRKQCGGDARLALGRRAVFRVVYQELRPFRPVARPSGQVVLRKDARTAPSHRFRILPILAVHGANPKSMRVFCPRPLLVISSYRKLYRKVFAKRDRFLGAF